MGGESCRRISGYISTTGVVNWRKEAANRKKAVAEHLALVNRASESNSTASSGQEGVTAGGDIHTAIVKLGVGGGYINALQQQFKPKHIWVEDLQ